MILEKAAYVMVGRRGTVTDTRRKLGDAEYWLRRLRRIRRTPTIFRRTLDAFLAAARSVVDFMRSEYESVPGFKGWEAQEWKRLMQDQDTIFLYDARHRAIHRELHFKPMRPAQTHPQINATFRDYASATDRISITRINTDGTVGPTTTSPPPEPAPRRKSEATIKHVWVFGEFPDTDVVTLCEHLLNKLEHLVATCETTYPLRP